MLKFFMLIKCRDKSTNINKVINTFESISLLKTNEENITEKMGKELIRDQTDEDLILLYAVSDGLNYYILAFHLKKNQGGIFFLHQKKKISNKNLKSNNITELQTIFNQIVIAQKNKSQEDLESKDENKESEKKRKELKNDLKENFIYENLYSFAHLVFNSNDKNSTEEIFNSDKLKLKKEYTDMEKNIKMYFIMSLIISNEKQEMEFVNHTKSMIIDKFKITKEELEKMNLSNKALLSTFGYSEFFLSQYKSLKQFCKYGNAIKFHAAKQDVLAKNSNIFATYSLYENGELKFYKNIPQFEIPSFLFPYLLKGCEMNKKIILPNNRYVLFHEIIKEFVLDQMIEVNIISIPNVDKHEVEMIVNSCSNNCLVESKLREKFPFLEFQKRNISLSSDDQQDQEIYNALNYYKSRMIFQQDDKVIVLLQIREIQSKAKINKPKLNKKSEDFQVFLQIILITLGKNIKFKK